MTRRSRPNRHHTGRRLRVNPEDANRGINTSVSETGSSNLTAHDQLCEDITIWIIVGMIAMVILGAVLYGMIWIVMDMYHENCYLCGKKMDVMHKRESDYIIELAEMKEREMVHKKQIDNMSKREKVISNQVHLITTFRQGMYEAQRSMDQYIATIEEYCKLKATHDSWFYSLTVEQENYMYRLRHYLGLPENVNVKAATVIVRQYSEQTQKILTVQLEELEDTLSKMNIREMKRLQVAMNEARLSNLLETQMAHAKSNIISMSRELQVRGAFDLIFSLFYDVLKAAITTPVVAEIIKNVMLS